jgi:hypothetical protein
MKKTIYVLGNPLEDIDKLPIQLLPVLQQTFPDIEFILFDPTEELPQPIPKHLYLLDTVLGITTVTIFTDMNDFLISPRISVHDFDLPLFLGMLKKLGKIDDVTIIGIPPNLNEKEALDILPLYFEKM